MGITYLCRCCITQPGIEMTSRIRTVSSTSHPITFEFGDEPTQGVVTLQPTPEGLPPIDFILLTKLAEPHLYA